MRGRVDGRSKGRSEAASGGEDEAADEGVRKRRAGQLADEMRMGGEGRVGGVGRRDGWICGYTGGGSIRGRRKEGRLAGAPFSSSSSTQRRPHHPD